MRHPQCQTKQQTVYNLSILHPSSDLPWQIATDGTVSLRATTGSTKALFTQYAAQGKVNNVANGWVALLHNNDANVALCAPASGGAGQGVLTCQPYVDNAKEFTFLIVAAGSGYYGLLSQAQTGRLWVGSDNEGRLILVEDNDTARRVTWRFSPWPGGVCDTHKPLPDWTASLPSVKAVDPSLTEPAPVARHAVFGRMYKQKTACRCTL